MCLVKTSEPYQFGHVENRIFVVVFLQAQRKKSKQIFEIQHSTQIEDMPSKEVCNGGVACSLIQLLRWRLTSHALYYKIP